MRVRSWLCGAVAGCLAVGTALVGLAGPAAAQPGGPPSARSSAASSAGGHEKLDVLFVGAHPDDESGELSTYGQWAEKDHVRTGILTITRGEGGGNAVGPEEGPPLGLLREGEERKALDVAGIHDVDYLDKVDFYYTVSAPLTDQVWKQRDTLARVVRVVRETQPKVVVTMDPAPVPGQHGNHQVSGRLATEAYRLAADPKAFPEQITREGLRPWRVGRLFLGGASVTGPTGSQCASAFEAADPSADVFGVWSGTHSSRHDTSWAQAERVAQRFYASQGWAVFPDEPKDPSKLPCDYFTQVESRVPFTAGATGRTAMLEGAVVPARGGLPLGTEFYLTTDRFDVTPGTPLHVVAHARSGHGTLRDARVALDPPAGWRVSGTGRLGAVGAGERTTRFTLTPAADAKTGTRVRLAATLRTATGHGTTDRALAVRAAVRGQQQPLPQVADFVSWTAQAQVPQLEDEVARVLTLGSGGSRDVRIDLTNDGDEARSGTVHVALPKGFAADATTKRYASIPAGGHGSVTFRVRNTDASLPTSNEGGEDGDHAYTITTTAGGQQAVETGALELVPVTVIPHATKAPTLDGKVSAGEYTGRALDLSRRWEGDPCTSKADCSATAHVTWSGDALYVAAQVTDDTLGTVLDPADCKRHWRIDSVEIAVDPRGTSENTSTTFKAGVLPTTTTGSPCFERDADNRQGPGKRTAPGMQVASSLTKPYRGYTIEAKIPMADLPSAVDPKRMGLNLFVYDSDTKDKTGQTRNGWSTWGGVQGDPYRWGLATLPGYTPPAGRSTTPKAPVIPSTAAQSVDSPQSILQAATTGLPLAGLPAAPASDTARLTGAGHVRGGGVGYGMRATGPGTAHLFVWDPAAGTLGSRTVHVDRAGRVTGTVRVAHPGKVTAKTRLLLAYAAKAGGTASTTVPVRR